MPNPRPTTPEDADRADEQGRRAEALVILAVLLGVFAMLGSQAVIGRWRQSELEIDRLPKHRLDYRIDINSAKPLELLHLPGIGPKLARRIIEDRERNGPFVSSDDLQRVKGIGPKLSAQVEPYLRFPLAADAPGHARSR